MTAWEMAGVFPGLLLEIFIVFLHGLGIRGHHGLHCCWGIGHHAGILARHLLHHVHLLHVCCHHVGALHQVHAAPMLLLSHMLHHSHLLHVHML